MSLNMSPALVGGFLTTTTTWEALSGSLREWIIIWLRGVLRKIPWRRDRLPTPVFLGFPGGSDGKESACGRPGGDLGLIPGLGRSPGEGMATRSSVLAWRIPWITVHAVANLDMTERLLLHSQDGRLSIASPASQKVGMYALYPVINVKVSMAKATWLAQRVPNVELCDANSEPQSRPSSSLVLRSHTHETVFLFKEGERGGLICKAFLLDENSPSSLNGRTVCPLNQQGSYFSICPEGKPFLWTSI